MGRTIVFGDVHGCYQEWKDLIKLLEGRPADRVISVGDLISKGPSSAKTLELALSLKNLTCLLGNHEFRFLKAWKKMDTPDEKSYDSQTVREMGSRFERYMKWISSWPYYVSLRALVVIYAGLLPGIARSKQDPRDLTQLRRI